MIYLADVFLLILIFFICMALIIVGVEYDKAKKWNDIFKKGGRDD